MSNVFVGDNFQVNNIVVVITDTLDTCTTDFVKCDDVPHYFLLCFLHTPPEWVEDGKVALNNMELLGYTACECMNNINRVPVCISLCLMKLHDLLYNIVAKWTIRPLASYLLESCIFIKMVCRWTDHYHYTLYTLKDF